MTKSKLLLSTPSTTPSIIQSDLSLKSETKSINNQQPSKQDSTTTKESWLNIPRVANAFQIFKYWAKGNNSNNNNYNGHNGNIMGSHDSFLEKFSRPHPN
ncbi:hypothetical protein BLA29_014321, partial [Euroglyphus maynei]